MKLSPEQLAQFDRDGYLFFPGLFTPQETQTLTDSVPALYSKREAYNVRERGSDAVRTNFAAHLYSSSPSNCATGSSMRGWRASLAKGSLYRCAAKFVRTASDPRSRTL